MLSNENPIIILPKLPDVSKLEEICMYLNELADLPIAKEHAFMSSLYSYYCTREEREIRKLSRQQEKVVEQIKGLSRTISDISTFLAEKAVHSTILTLALFYNLDNKFKSFLPSVELIDFSELSERSGRYSQYVIWDGYPPGGVGVFPSNSCFTPNGFEFYSQPPGPVVSLNIKDTNLNTIVEESIHFLQWFYESPEYLKKIRFSKENLAPEEQGSGRAICEIKIKGNPIIRANYIEEDLAERISKGILHEALAYFTRDKFGLEDKKSEFEKIESSKNLKILGIPEKNSPYELLQIFLDKGVKSCYQTLLEWNDILSLEEIYRKIAFRNCVSEHPFPSDLTHYLGYELGERLSKNIKSQNNLKDLGKSVFKSGNPEEKLSSLINMHLALSS